MQSICSKWHYFHSVSRLRSLSLMIDVYGWDDFVNDLSNSCLLAFLIFHMSKSIFTHIFLVLLTSFPSLSLSVRFNSLCLFLFSADHINLWLHLISMAVASFWFFQLLLSSNSIETSFVICWCVNIIVQSRKNSQISANGSFEYYKIVKRIVYAQILEHLKIDNTTEKFHLHTRHSSETSLLRVISDMLTPTDNGNPSILIMLHM